MGKVNNAVDVYAAIRNQDASITDIQSVFPDVKRDVLIAALQAGIDANQVRRYIEGRTVMYGMVIGADKKAVGLPARAHGKNPPKPPNDQCDLQGRDPTTAKPKAKALSKAGKAVTQKPAKRARAHAPVGKIKDTFILEEGARLNLKDIIATRAYTQDEAVKAAERIVASGGSGASSLLVVQIHAIVRPVIKTFADVEKDPLKVKKK